MVDGVHCQAALRPLIAAELRDFAEARERLIDVSHDQLTFAWLEVIVNSDRFRNLCDSIIAEGS